MKERRSKLQEEVESEGRRAGTKGGVEPAWLYAD
jgi:hypothetical protein